MKLLYRSLMITLLVTLCASCGSADSDNATQSPVVDTSAVAGFWNFSSTDPEFPDEQYVELTNDGQWHVFAQFPNDSATQNCYDRQITTFKPVGNDMYEARSPTGTVVEIGLVVVNDELVYTLNRPDSGQLFTSTFPAVNGLTPSDLPVCG